MIKPRHFFLFLLLIFAVSQSVTADSTSAKDLIGIWKAKRNFGPDIRGPLTISRQGQNWEVEISGYRVLANVDGKKIDFKIPGKRGEFTGTIQTNGISGHWIQQPLITNGTSYASPVMLKENGKDRWIGEVIPLEDEFTL